MPLILKNHLPAVKALEEEGLFTVTPERALTQDIRPLKIALVNLMPTKTTTEIQFMRLLSNSPLQIEFTLLCMGSHHSVFCQPDTDLFHIQQLIQKKVNRLVG